MTVETAIEKIKDGRYSIYKDVDNIPLLNRVLGGAFKNKETHDSYVDNYFCGNQVEGRWIGKFNNNFPVPFIKLSDIIG